MTREHAVQFGAGDRLSGIVTEPVAGGVRGAFVLVTVAFNPKFGPYRIHVEWARALAAHGIAVLRFDLGGIGDSVPMRAGSLRARTHRELGAAAGLMSSRFPGVPLMMGGICSGAEDALRYAEGDARVTRVLLVDPFAYRTPGWRWRHELFRVRRRLLRFTGRWRRHAATVSDGGIIAYTHMAREESSRLLGALHARGACAHLIYTAGRQEQVNHPSQVQRMFPAHPLREVATVDLLPGIDHTQIIREDRELLLRTVSARLTAPFPARDRR